MCLAIPGKIIKIYMENGLRMGHVDYSGAISEVCLEYVPEAEIDSYVIVHAGFAISVLNEEQARLTLEAWDDVTGHLQQQGYAVEHGSLAAEMKADTKKVASKK